MKVLSLFSGIGAPEQALKNIGVNVELVGFSEIDKYAIKSYCTVHNVSENMNLGDITKINIESLPLDIDLITHGSPCQDFSVAGNNKGGDKGSGTRSSLMWCTVDIVKHCKPKYILWENVKNLLSKKHKHNFDEYIRILNELGYNNYYQVLNAKDYGIPQNRERVFTISIRKDIDNGFIFPEKQELKLTLKDMLENEVDEKYYIDPSKTNKLINECKKELKDEFVADYRYDEGLRIRKELISPCLTLKCGSVSLSSNPFYCKKYKVRVANKTGYQIAEESDSIDLEQPSSNTRRGRVQKQSVGTLNTSDHKAVVDNYRIRKLTPKECWRLMGFKDEQFKKAEKVCSNTQLYKQAGNSIVVNVLEEIFKRMI